MISIVTVNYNSRELLRECISSLLEQVRVPYEIIVVDNGSTDGSADNLPGGDRVRVLFQNANLGFAQGCNRGARVASGEVLHFLNPDTQVDLSINAAYETALLEKRDFTFTTRLADMSGRVEKTNHVIPTLTDMFNLAFAPEKARHWHIGASVLVRTDLFRRIGGFSEDYFMYSEDMDFFYKFHLAGIPNRQLNAIVLHHKGGCSRNVWSAWQRLGVIEKSGFIFAEKFDLRFDYFVFRHLAFFRNVIIHPITSFMGLQTYWKTFVGRLLGSVESAARPSRVFTK